MVDKIIEGQTRNGGSKMQNEVMTLNKSADYLGIWCQTLRTWADRGRIPCIKEHRGWRYFKVSDLERVKRDLEAKKGNARQI